MTKLDYTTIAMDKSRLDCASFAYDRILEAWAMEPKSQVYCYNCVAVFNNSFNECSYDECGWVLEYKKSKGWPPWL